MDERFNDDIIMIADGRPSRSDAVKNRALLLETARQLFDRYGVDDVSMSAIAEAAGVGKGTLYRHFTSKTELCLGLLDKDQRDLQERTLERLRAVHDPYENLRWFVGQVVGFVSTHRKWLCTSALAEGQTVLEHPAHWWWRQTVRSLLQQLRVSGDLDYLADAIYLLLNAHMVQFQQHALGYDAARIERGLLDLIDRILD